MKITEFLNPESILLDVEAKTSDQVIKLLGERLFQLGCVKENFVVATLDREANMPTGLPLGGEVTAASPHVDIEYVHQSALAIATLREPVVFYNMVDTDVPVHVRLVIMLALDKPKAQIEMLTSVASVLQDSELINQIMAAANAEEVLTALATSQ
jgi:PTS system galactitol-specific IIA component